MRAKKLIALALLATIGTTVQAQIVSSQSSQVIVTEQSKPQKQKKPKKPRTFKWNLRLEYSFDSMTGAEDLSGTSGFDTSFGISKAFGNNGMFWGVEAGAMTYGACMNDYHSTRCIVVDIAPRIGIKMPLGEKTALSFYGGPYIGVTSGNNDTSGKSQDLWFDENADVGLNIGAELFVSNNVFFNLQVKKGLTSAGYSGFGVYDGFDWNYDSSKEIYALKIMLGIGFQF